MTKCKYNDVGTMAGSESLTATAHLVDHNVHIQQTARSCSHRAILVTLVYEVGKVCPRSHNICHKAYFKKKKSCQGSLQ